MGTFDPKENPVVQGVRIGDVSIHHTDGRPRIRGDKEWLFAEGGLCSRKENPILYSIIGMSYSDEDKRCCTAEMFVLPDHRKPNERGQ